MRVPALLRLLLVGGTVAVIVILSFSVYLSPAWSLFHSSPTSWARSLEQSAIARATSDQLLMEYSVQTSLHRHLYRADEAKVTTHLYRADEAKVTTLPDTEALDHVLANWDVYHSHGSSWEEGTFCSEFISDKFSYDVAPCGAENDRVLCRTSSHDSNMGMCTVQGLAVDTKSLYATLQKGTDKLVSSNAAWLVWDSHTNPCASANFNDLERHVVGGDYMKQLVKTSVLSSPRGSCTTWINGTTFFYMGFDVHIYFKFLSWFNLHNSLLNYFRSHGELPSHIVRVPETTNEFLFPEYERKLYAEVPLLLLKDLSTTEGKEVVCFERVTMSPWAFASPLFRCKMSSQLKQKCYRCFGKNFNSTTLDLFRKRALRACSINPTQDHMTPWDGTIRNIVVQVRKQYDRFHGDRKEKFSRVLKNSEELVNHLNKAFPAATVQTMYAEELPICEQMLMAYKADVFIGVHGAGLVHLWWMQDHAVLVELNPASQLGNPTFRMLSLLVGRRYLSYTNVAGGEKQVYLKNLSDLVAEIKKSLL